jgi:hypothetical protein
MMATIRCVASLGSGQSVLRLSISYDKKYMISTPGVGKNSNLIMYIEPVDGDDISFNAQSDGRRTWGSLDAQQFRNFLRIKNEISVQVDGVKFNYLIGNTSLAEVARKTEQCNSHDSGATAAQLANPTGQPTLRSGSYTMDSSNSQALVTLIVQGTAFSGQSSWQCCPSARIDPIVEGSMANGRVTFVRDCRGQGQPDSCRQTYTGVISGNSASGTWSGTGAPAGGGRWSMRLR